MSVHHTPVARRSLLLSIAGWALAGPALAETAVKLPPPGDAAATGTAAVETAVFAGGCFWGVQAIFQHTKGVQQAVSGYTGGRKDNAFYEAVSEGTTGHAEAVQVSFDPRQVSYGRLLQIFFSVAHDPTQLNRQGPDTGTQYRSALFTTSAVQKATAERYIAQLDAAKLFPAKIVTAVVPLKAFYPAEDRHQDYATRHPDADYIVAYDQPKIDNFRAMLPELYRAAPALVRVGSSS
ncbi:MAG: msrA [Rhodoferax sp.]|nr:msrA [Rhodoferax sp.]